MKIMMSPREFAAYSGLGINLVSKLCRLDTFPSSRVGRRHLIHVASASEWLAEASRRGIDLAYEVARFDTGA